MSGRAWGRRLAGAAAFALLALITELTGRSVTVRLDRAFHVAPLALPTTRYYPFLLAGGWGAVRDWLAEVEDYAAATIACVCRIVRSCGTSASGPRPADDRAPRQLFGRAFESRPPPLPA